MVSIWPQIHTHWLHQQIFSWSSVLDSSTSLLLLPSNWSKVRFMTQFTPASGRVNADWWSLWRYFLGEENGLSRGILKAIGALFSGFQCIITPGSWNIVYDSTSAPSLLYQAPLIISLGCVYLYISHLHKPVSPSVVFISQMDACRSQSNTHFLDYTYK